MTTPISDGPNAPNTWNYLPTATIEFDPWPFFMLMDGLAGYLVGSTDGQLNYYAGQTAVLRLDSNQRLTSYLLTAPPKNPEDPRAAAVPEQPVRRIDRSEAASDRGKWHGAAGQLSRARRR